MITASRIEGLARVGRRWCKRQAQRRDRVWSFVRITLVAFFALFGCTYAWMAEDLPELRNYSASELARTSVLYDSGSNLIDEL